ncbi:MAG: hypothetical protein V1809_12340 [Planctomycetota bacterium]
MRTILLYTLAAAFLSGCTTPDRQQHPRIKHTLQFHEIEKAKVINEWQAKEIAMSSVTKTDGGVSATAMFNVGPCFKIDFDIPNFAKQGERIWPVSKTDMAFPSCQTIWINAESGDVKVIAKESTTCSKLVEYEYNLDQMTDTFTLDKKTVDKIKQSPSGIPKVAPQK